MAESLVQVTEGSGKKLHSYQRTIGANNVEDEIMVLGEPYLAAYAVATGTALTLGTAQVIVQLMAGASLNLRVTRVTVKQRALAGAVGTAVIELRRITVAGSGGTAITPQQMETGDSASGATCQTIPTVAPTLGSRLGIRTLGLVAAEPVPDSSMIEWRFDSAFSKPIVIAAGTANGLAINVSGAIATATCYCEIEFHETSF